VSESKAMAVKLSQIADGWRLVAKLAKKDERNGLF
jgi:hypothetical protein